MPGKYHGLCTLSNSQCSEFSFRSEEGEKLFYEIFIKIRFDEI